MAAEVLRQRVGDAPEGPFTSHRATFCGALPVGGSVAILRGTDGRAGLGGLQHCGTLACPVCAATVAAERTREVAQVLAAAREAGHTVVMVTLTVRHDRGTPLADLWDAVGAGWRGITTASAWAGESVASHEKRLSAWRARGALSDADLGTRAPRGWAARQEPARRIGLREQWGVLGTICATEVTHSLRAGWHPHRHALVVLEGRREPHEAEALGREMHALWAKALAKKGFESWRDSGGLHVDVMEATAESIARYVAKASSTLGVSEAEALAEVRSGITASVQGMAMEATRGDLKIARSARGETPFELLARAVDGEADAVPLWREYLAASQGRRVLTITRGLREMAALEDERSDEEIAEEAVGDDADCVLIAAADWPRVQPRAADLLALMENVGPAGLCAELDRVGVPWEIPPPQTPPPPR